jgi:myo-inositol 2-dehydrogenase / D-chiro-inositol 1-dehydrogenase
MNKLNETETESHINRRDFLKTTSTIVAGTSLLNYSAIAQGAHVATDETLKLALIGCGGRGSGAADQALTADQNVKLIAMGDTSAEHLKKSLENLTKEHAKQVDVPEDHQFVGFDAYQKAIAMADVVILATPPGFRPTHFECAVSAGKNIFMEKPVAVDGPGIRRVLAAAKIAKDKNLKVAVGLQRRHQEPYLETIKRLHDGAIGDIVSMRCYWNGSRPWIHPRKSGMSEMEFQMDNWYYFTWLCGDHVVEQHIHNLDVINWIKQGYPVRARGMGGCQSPRNSDCGEIFDHHAVQFEYADGSHCFSECRHIKGCWDSVSEHATGTKGTVDTADGREFVIKGSHAWKFKGKQTMSPWQAEHYPFFEAIRKNKDYNEAERGAMSTMTAILGRMATYSGKIIEFDKALNSELVLAPDNISWDAKPKPQCGSDGLYPMPIPGDPEWFKRII